MVNYPKDLIKLQVNYQTLNLEQNNYPYLVTDTRNSLKYQIIFNDDDITESKWEGKGKIVVFTTPDGFTKTQFYPPQTDNDLPKQYVPKEMLDETRFQVSVYSLGDERITTNPVTIELKKSGYRKTVETGLTALTQEHNLPYLYKAEYSDLDYDYALRYFKQENIPVPDGACSAVYNNNIMGRNLDWLYSEMVDCIIKTPTTIGVAGAMTEFTREFAESAEYNEIYRILPFYLQDGVNKNGLCCATLVTPNIVSHSVPSEKIKESISSIMLVRYILDHFTSLQEAVDYLTNYVEIIFHPKLCEMDYNQHWILGQGKHCVILEVDSAGKLVSIPYHDKKCSVTNFHMNNVILNSDGTVYTPVTQTSTEDAVKTNHIHSYGAGLERFNIIQQTPVVSVDTVQDLMKKLNYSKIYNINTHWYTDFASKSEALLCNTDSFIYEKIVAKYAKIYPLRSRKTGSVGYGFWNTNHSSVYDTENKKLIICSQENEEWYEYTL